MKKQVLDNPRSDLTAIVTTKTLTKHTTKNTSLTDTFEFKKLQQRFPRTAANLHTVKMMV